MNVDFGSLVKKLVANGAPVLGGALGGPMGSVVATQIARTLGVEPEPEAIAKALASNPDAMLELRKLDAEMAKTEAQSAKDLGALEVADRASARAMRASGDDMIRMVLTLFLVPTPIVILLLLITGKFTLTTADTVTISLLIGYMLNNAGSAVSFYFGTSIGSARKQKTIESDLTKAMTP